MSLDNKYILSKSIRKKLKWLDKKIFYITMILFFIIIFIYHKKIINLFIFSLITLFLFILNIALMIIVYSEKKEGKFYSIYIIVFYICIFLSSISLLCGIVIDNYVYNGDIQLSDYIKRVIFYGEILGLYSFTLGTLLLFFNKCINTLLFSVLSNKLKFEIDSVSNRFAVDVLTCTIYIGSLFGLIVYGLFYSEENQSSFFAEINVTHVAIATVGFVTFFWAAKSAKSKSIELDMTRSREAGRLFSDGSLFLSAADNDRKYVGLFYLNMIAGQSEGPLQKEAIDLMADFILKANDVTTANKPRIRAMEYLSDRLKTDFWDDDIDELIKLSSSELIESNANYRFSQLNVIYENFNFSNDEKYLRYKLLEENKIIKKNEGIWSRLIRKNNSKLTEDDSCKLIAYNNCNFEKFSGQNGIEKIILIYANNCRFKKCKIGIVKGYSKKPETLQNVGQQGESTSSNNKFEQCDFSDSDGWNILRSSNRMEGEISETVAENEFINCFYYWGHEPKGFVKERDGALLTEITSKEQFDELIGSSSFMQYAPPDD